MRLERASPISKISVIRGHLRAPALSSISAIRSFPPPKIQKCQKIRHFTVKKLDIFKNTPLIVRFICFVRTKFVAGQAYAGLIHDSQASTTL